MDPQGGGKILCAMERISYYSVLIIFSKCKVTECKESYSEYTRRKINVTCLGKDKIFLYVDNFL